MTCTVAGGSRRMQNKFIYSKKFPFQSDLSVDRRLDFFNKTFVPVHSNKVLFQESRTTHLHILQIQADISLTEYFFLILNKLFLKKLQVLILIIIHRSSLLKKYIFRYMTLTKRSHMYLSTSHSLLVIYLL